MNMWAVCAGVVGGENSSGRSKVGDNGSPDDDTLDKRLRELVYYL